MDNPRILLDNPRMLLIALPDRPCAASIFRYAFVLKHYTGAVVLKNTFIHLDGIGIATERKLWRIGIRSWDDLVRRGLEYLPPGLRSAVAAELQESAASYAAGRWAFFEQRLASSQKWRAYPDLKAKALYLDIETTGLGAADAITLVGAYDGAAMRYFVSGINLADAVGAINSYPMLVTFNGTGFDLPMIRKCLGGISADHIHLDLRHCLRALGYRGGLKAIEQTCGIRRSTSTRFRGGWDAVRLWNEYLAGSGAALELLKEYNGEDVKNLQKLAEIAWEQSSRRIGFECTA